MKGLPVPSRTKMLIGGLLVCQTLCMLPGLFAWSAVWDEPGHLASGMNHWQYSDFRPYCVNPPLCRMLATAPALLVARQATPVLREDEPPYMRGEFALGRRLFDQDPPGAIKMLRVARSVAMLWPLAGTVLMFWMGSRVFGRGAGWVAAVTWAFNPMVIAHGVLLPPDIPAAIGLCIAAIATANWLRQPGSGAAILLGFALGIAILIKTTMLIGAVVVPALAVVACLTDRKLVWGRCLQLVVASAVTLFVINVGYFWTGSFTKLGDYVFVSELLSGVHLGDGVIQGNRFQQTLLAGLPVPLPSHFILGIDIQYRDFERGGFYPYLAGKWDRDGFLMFYVYYYLFKMPTAGLVLFIFGACLLVAKLDRWRESVHDGPLLVSLVTFALAAFLLISSRTDLNYCQRYALVSLPGFCLIGAAAWAHVRTKWQEAMVLVLVIWSVGAGVSSVPNSLAYYNEFAGGVSNGRFILHGQATDWAQDGLRLGEWCQQHPERRPLSVATTGSLDLSGYGVVADSLRTDGIQMAFPAERAVVGEPISLEGWHVVSIVHLLYPESPYFPLRYREPEEWIGETHAVFYLDRTTANELRDGTLKVLPPMRGHENDRF